MRLAGTRAGTCGGECDGGDGAIASETAKTTGRNMDSEGEKLVLEKPPEMSSQEEDRVVEGPQKRARNQKKNRLCLSSDGVEVGLRGVVEDKLPEKARSQGRNRNSVMARPFEMEGRGVEELCEVSWTQGRNRQSPRKVKLTERPLETGRNYSGISVLRTTLKQAINHPKRSFILFNP